MSKKTKSQVKSAATLTVHRAGQMTPKGRASVVKWLRQQASNLSRHGKLYSARFTARYLYAEKAPRKPTP